MSNVVGGYFAQVGGFDAIVLTGGVGETDSKIRLSIANALNRAFGVKCDADKDQVRGEETLLSTPDSRVALWLIPTNEELMIARDAYRLLDFS